MAILRSSGAAIANRAAIVITVAGAFASAPLWSIPPLAQLPGTAGCVSETGSGGDCEDGKALIQPQGWR